MEPALEFEGTPAATTLAIQVCGLRNVAVRKGMSTKMHSRYHAPIRGARIHHAGNHDESLLDADHYGRGANNGR